MIKNEYSHIIKIYVSFKIARFFGRSYIRWQRWCFIIQHEAYLYFTISFEREYRFSIQNIKSKKEYIQEISMKIVYNIELSQSGIYRRRKSEGFARVHLSIRCPSSNENWMLKVYFRSEKTLILHLITAINRRGCRINPSRFRVHSLQNLALYINSTL